MRFFIFVFCLLFSGAVFADQKFPTLSEEQVIEYAASKNFFDPRFVLAIAKVESGLNPKAQNKEHYGLMQIKSGTARMLGYLGPARGLFAWRANIDLAMKYLTEKYVEYLSLPQVAAAYNAGKVYICRTGMSKGTPCKKGRFVNQEYVDSVMRVYRSLEDRKFPAVDSHSLWLALQDST